MRKCIITTSAFVGCCCTYFNNVSTHSASVLCVGMAMHAFNLLQGSPLLCAVRVHCLPDFLRLSQLGTFQFSLSVLNCLDSSITLYLVKSLYPSIHLNHSEVCQCQQVFEDVLHCQKKYVYPKGCRA